MNQLTLSPISTDRTPIEVLLQIGDDERVSARDVSDFLRLLPENFSRWAKTNIAENDFAESGADFNVVFIEEDVVGGKGAIRKNRKADYRLSIPFAKKLCMLSRSERGEQARNYFISVEDKLKHVAQTIPTLTPNEMILQLATEAVKRDRQIAALQESDAQRGEEIKQLSGKFDKAIETLATPSLSWQDNINISINQLIEFSGAAKCNLLGRMYIELEAVNGCDLKSRLTRERNRMAKSGYTYKQRTATTKLDIIAKDKALRSAFENILRQYQARYIADAL